LQQTGKTTFLAALWDVVSSGEVIGSLRLERTDGDMQYLNEIRAAWGDCKAITRTGPAVDKPVTMHLKDTALSTVTELAWTDMLGERFERQWTDRAWNRGYQQLVDSATGVLLFVHPRRIKESPLIIDAQPLVLELEREESTSPEVSGAASVPTATQYDGRKVPTQVQLVEILQFLDTRRTGADRIRLAIVVSAWDLVEKTMKDVAPCSWFAGAMPLLRQFVATNHERFDSKVFSVSAQGGDYEEEAKLQAHYKSSERIKVVWEEITSHDITAPVRWAIGSML
jgi:hypothetical protein